LRECDEARSFFTVIDELLEFVQRILEVEFDDRSRRDGRSETTLHFCAACARDDTTELMRGFDLVDTL
jgi:hypothetical protein